MWEAITTSSPWLGLVQTDSLRGETLLPYTAIALTALAGTPATVTKSLCLYGEQRKGFSLATVKVYGDRFGHFSGNSLLGAVDRAHRAVGCQRKGNACAEAEWNQSWTVRC